MSEFFHNEFWKMIKVMVIYIELQTGDPFVYLHTLWKWLLIFSMMNSAAAPIPATAPCFLHLYMWNGLPCVFGFYYGGRVENERVLIEIILVMDECWYKVVHLYAHSLVPISARVSFRWFTSWELQAACRRWLRGGISVIENSMKNLKSREPGSGIVRVCHSVKNLTVKPEIIW